jgi:LacI family transcriptional regulator
VPNAVRAEGYRHAMRARGSRSISSPPTYTQEGGYLGTQQVLARPDRPTAIFAGADVVAMEVLQALTEADLAVPNDLSVAGYDNTTFAALGPISLTSVDQAGHQIGANAARLLLDPVADRQRPIRTHQALPHPGGPSHHRPATTVTPGHHGPGMSPHMRVRR